ncbi:unnamed protein product, partial [Meganyctiphanes norvegica]
MEEEDIYQVIHRKGVLNTGECFFNYCNESIYDLIGLSPNDVVCGSWYTLDKSQQSLYNRNKDVIVKRQLSQLDISCHNFLFHVATDYLAKRGKKMDKNLKNKIKIIVTLRNTLSHNKNNEIWEIKKIQINDESKISLNAIVLKDELNEMLLLFDDIFKELGTYLGKPSPTKEQTYIRNLVDMYIKAVGTPSLCIEKIKTIEKAFQKEVSELTKFNMVMESTAKTLNTSTLQIETSVKTIDTSTKEMKNTAQSLDTSTQQIKTTTQTIATSTQQMENTALKVDASTHKMENMAQTLDASTQQMKNTNLKVDASSLQMENMTQSLNASTKQIEITAIKVDASSQQIENVAQTLDTSHQQMKNTSLKVDATTLQMENTSQILETSTQQMENTALKVDASTQQMENTALKVDASTLQMENTTQTLLTSSQQIERMAHRLDNSFQKWESKTPQLYHIDIAQGSKYTENEEELEHKAKEELNNYYANRGRIRQNTCLPNEIEFESSYIDISKIFTEYMLFMNQNREEVNFRNILKIKGEVIIVVGDGSVGKTVSLMYMAQKPDEIIGLEEHTFILHLECKNRSMISIENIFENLFDKVWQKLGMKYESFEEFVKKKNPIFLIDGYDQKEAHTGGNNLIKKILEVFKCRCVLTTRPHSLHDVTDLCDNSYSSYAVLTLQGINFKNFLEFSNKYLCMLNLEESDRKEILCRLERDFPRLYMCLGSAMNSPLTLQNIICWQSYVYLDCKSANETNPNTLLLSTLGKILETLFSMKIKGARLRLNNDEVYIEEQEEIIDDFLYMYYKLCFKTFLNNEFDLSENTEKELKKDCNVLLNQRKNLKDHLLSIFFTVTICKNKNSYKFVHQIYQEFGYSKFLVEHILNGPNKQESDLELLNKCFIWNYLSAEENNINMLERKSQELKHFGNVISFLTCEVARLKKERKLNNAFEKIAVKIIDLAWFVGESMVSRDAENERTIEEVDFTNEDRVKEDKSKKSEKADNILRDRPMTSQISQLQKEILKEKYSDLGIASENIFHKTEKDVVLKQCQEDAVLMLLIEAEFDENIINAVAGRLQSKLNWVIMNPVCLPALKFILENYSRKENLPKRIQFTINDDPLMFPEFDKVLQILKEKEIKTLLHFNEHYKLFFENKHSNKFIDNKMLLLEFIGRLTSEGIEQLPCCLVDLHISIQIEEISNLNKKLEELQHLRTLDLKVEIRENSELEVMPHIHYDKKLCLIIVAEDLDMERASKVVAKLQPVKTSRPMNLCFQNTSYSYENICELIKALKDANVNPLACLKVWSSVSLNENKVLEVKKIAVENGLGGFEFYLNLDINEGLPKKMIIQDVKSQLNLDLKEGLLKKMTIPDINSQAGSSSQQDATEAISSLHVIFPDEDVELLQFWLDAAGGDIEAATSLILDLKAQATAPQ